MLRKYYYIYEESDVPDILRKGLVSKDRVCLFPESVQDGQLGELTINKRTIVVQINGVSGVIKRAILGKGYQVILNNEKLTSIIKKMESRILGSTVKSCVSSDITFSASVTVNCLRTDTFFQI